MVGSEEWRRMSREGEEYFVEHLGWELLDLLAISKLRSPGGVH